MFSAGHTEAPFRCTECFTVTTDYSTLFSSSCSWESIASNLQGIKDKQPFIVKSGLSKTVLLIYVGVWQYQQIYVHIICNINRSQEHFQYLLLILGLTTFKQLWFLMGLWISHFHLLHVVGMRLVFVVDNSFWCLF